jgi:hypothetical protein
MFKALGNLIHEGVMYKAGQSYTKAELKDIPAFLRDEMFVPAEAEIKVEAESNADESLSNDFTVKELTAKLEELGVEIPAGAKKPELVALLDAKLEELNA